MVAAPSAAKVSSVTIRTLCLQFLCGAFFANCIPHITQAMTGHAFPSPFASPPGQGLSSPSVNILWGWLNLVVAYALGIVGHFDARNVSCGLSFLLGFLALALPLTLHFAKVVAP